MWLFLLLLLLSGACQKASPNELTPALTEVQSTATVRAVTTPTISISQIPTQAHNKVTAAPLDTKTATSVSDTKLIAFSAFSGSTGQDVYLIKTDRSNLTKFTSWPGDEWDPAWSPDGKKIAFSGGESYDIYVRDLDTRKTQQITNDPSSNRFPSWSPDGQHIVFDSDRIWKNNGTQEEIERGLYYNLFRVKVDGSELIQLTDRAEQHNTSPAWSPDGKWIAFASDRNDNLDIYLMPAEGGDPINLTMNAANDVAPAWSPDGEYIAFCSDRDGYHEIYIMKRDGSNLKRITNNPGSDCHPGFSPDGKNVIFVGEYDQKPGVHIVDLLDFTVRFVVSLPNAVNPAWQP